MGGGEKKPRGKKGKSGPSSSSQSAQLLQASGGHGVRGFIGFGGTSSPVVGASTTTPSTGQLLESELQLLLKKLKKKDATTKLRALTELRNNLSTFAKSDVVLFLPHWAYIYTKLCTDNNRQVRELCNAVHGLIANAVKKELAPSLKTVMCSWYCSQFDPVKEVAAAALQSFEATFSEKKQLDVLLFCQDEMAINLQEIFHSRPDTLSDMRGTSKVDAQSKYDRVIATSLFALASLLEILLGKEHGRIVEACDDVIKNHMRRFSQEKSSIIRRALYKWMEATITCNPSLVEANFSSFAPLVLGLLGDKDSSVHAQLWSTVLVFMKQFPGGWGTVKPFKQVFPRLFAFLRHAGYGSATVTFPSLLPFWSLVPRDLVTQSPHLFVDFLQAVWKGRKSENLPPSFMHLLVAAFVECVRYELLQHPQESVVQKLLPLTRELVLYCISDQGFSRSQIQPVYACLADLYMGIAANEAEIGPLLVDAIWGDLKDLLLGLLENSKCSDDASLVCERIVVFLDACQEKKGDKRHCYTLVQSIWCLLLKQTSQSFAGHLESSIPHVMCSKLGVPIVNLFHPSEILSGDPNLFFAAKFLPVFKQDTELDNMVRLKMLLRLYKSMCQQKVLLVANTWPDIMRYSVGHPEVMTAALSIVLNTEHDINQNSEWTCGAIDNEVLLGAQRFSDNISGKDATLYLRMVQVALQLDVLSSSVTKKVVKLTCCCILQKSTQRIFAFEAMGYVYKLNWKSFGDLVVDVLPHIFLAQSCVEAHERVAAEKTWEVVLDENVILGLTTDQQAVLCQKISCGMWDILKTDCNTKDWGSLLAIGIESFEGQNAHEQAVVLLDSLTTSATLGNLLMEVETNSTNGNADVLCHALSGLAICIMNIGRDTVVLHRPLLVARFMCGLLALQQRLPPSEIALIESFCMQDLLPYIVLQDTSGEFHWDVARTSACLVSANPCQTRVDALQTILFYLAGDGGWKKEEAIKWFGEVVVVHMHHDISLFSLLTQATMASLCHHLVGTACLEEVEQFLVDSVCKIPNKGVETKTSAKVLQSLVYIWGQGTNGTDASAMARAWGHLRGFVYEDRYDYILSPDLEGAVMSIIPVVVRWAGNLLAKEDWVFIYRHCIALFDIDQGKAHLALTVLTVKTVRFLLEQAHTVGSGYHADVDDVVNLRAAIHAACFQIFVEFEKHFGTSMDGKFACDLSHVVRHMDIAEVASWEGDRDAFVLLSPLLFFAASFDIQVTAFVLLRKVVRARSEMEEDTKKGKVEETEYTANTPLIPIPTPFLNRMKDIDLYSEVTNAAGVHTAYGCMLMWSALLEQYAYCDANKRLDIDAILKEKSHNFAEFLSFLFLYIPEMLPLHLSSEKTIASFKFEDHNPVEHADDFLTVSAVAIYYTCVRLVPIHVRNWWRETPRSVSARVSKFTTAYISPLIIKQEIGLVKRNAPDTDEIRVRSSIGTREITATYFKDDASVDIVLKLPMSYPLGTVEVECKSRMGISEARWRKFLMAITMLLSRKNGKIVDAIMMWVDSLDKHFEGVEECPICYSILHLSNGSIPKLACRTCKHKFHAACLYKWFNTSSEVRCPMCRSPWSFT